MAIVIPYVKQTWTDGSGGGTPISAARLGVLEEGILDVSQAPCVLVTHNANQSITSSVSTFTAIAFNTEIFDQAGGASSTMHDTVTNNSRLTAVYAGIYLVTLELTFDAATTSYRQIGIRSSVGSNIRGRVTWLGYTGIGNYATTQIMISMAVNDYVEAVVNQNSGGAINIQTAASPNQSPFFGMVRVG